MKLSELLHLTELETGGLLSLEIFHLVFYKCDNLKLEPDQYIHRGDYCMYIKQQARYNECAENKKNSMILAGRGHSFCGICPHGIWEQAMPVKIDGKTAAILYLGYFREAKHELTPPAYIKPFAGRKPEVITAAKKEQVRRAGAFIRKFIELEARLFISGGGLDSKQNSEEFYLENCYRFIERHYRKNIALSDLAEVLQLNANYLGALLKNKSGKTFRQLLTERRLTEAAGFLKLHYKLSVSQVAQNCGYNDSNYFCRVFTEKYGLSPSAYRKLPVLAADKAQ